ncbi:MAG: DUF4115 domain-containing protein [Firmicutes bacterium]|nr:DUF4115 domain-containing protein [Bacillota bacterium]
MAGEVAGAMPRGGVREGGGVSYVRKRRRQRGLTYLAVTLLVLGLAAGVAAGWMMTTGELPFAVDRVPWIGGLFRRPGPVSVESPVSYRLPSVPAAEEVLPLLAQRSAAQLARPASVPVGRANPFQPVFGIEAGPPPEAPPPPEGAQPGGAGGAVAPGEAPASAPLQVGIRVTSPTWLEVRVDGKQVLRTNVARGSQLKYEASKQVTLQEVGREGAILLSVNGRDLGRASTLVKELSRPKQVEAGGHTVEISLVRRYPSGVLVGLTFALVK